MKQHNREGGSSETALIGIVVLPQHTAGFIPWNQSYANGHGLDQERGCSPWHAPCRDKTSALLNLAESNHSHHSIVNSL